MGIIAVFMFVAFIVFGAFIQTPDSQMVKPPPLAAKAHPVEAAIATVPEPPPAPSCSNDWKLCIDNAAMINEWNGLSLVQIKCKYAANDIAKYGHPDWSWFPFTNFMPGNDYPSTGMVTLIDRDVRFSNGFGAMTKVTAVCVYNLKLNKVTFINAASGD